MVTAPLYLLLAFQFTTSQKTAIDVLRTAKNAMIGAQSSAYLVNREYTDSSGNKYKGHTSIVIVKSPFEFRAVHSGDDGSSSETAVPDGKTTQRVTDGNQEQHTFGPDGPLTMNVGGDAEFDVAATWHLLLDAD